MSGQSAHVVYNGAVYNWRQLRTELAALGHAFRTETDTEAVLAAWSEWGTAMLDRLDGMFAFAIYDHPTRSLFVARDGCGVKPLYFAELSDGWAFASEAQALVPLAGAKVDRAGLSQYMTTQNIVGGRTLFEGIREFPAGSWMHIHADGRTESRMWWRWNFRGDETMTAEDARDEVRAALDESVALQCDADRPVGAYLSGGVDSGAIVSSAAAQGFGLSTFTLGWADPHAMADDERAQAEDIAQRYGTRHYEAIHTPGTMAALMPSIARHMGVPRVGQCHPNWQVAGLAGKFCQVVLSGAGGDELFGGYPWRYAAYGAPDGWRGRVQSWWRRFGVDGSDLVRPEWFDRAALNAAWAYSLDGLSPDTPSECIDAALTFESRTFLAGLLTVGDRASMAHGFELRVPFLSRRMVDLAQRIPARMKVGPGGDVGKRVMRSAVEPLIGAAAAWRRKQGFSAPDGAWFRAGPGAAFVDATIHPDARLWEYLQRGPCLRMVDEHRAGVANHRLLIWSLLAVEGWLRAHVEG